MASTPRVGLLALIAWALLAACSGPARSPQPSPHTTTAETATEMMIESTCAAFVARTDELFGGMPAARQIVYAAADGTVQQTREDTDDIVFSWREVETDASGLLSSLRDLPPSLPGATPASPDGREDGSELEVSEYAGPSLLVELSGCTASPWQWEGSVADAPPALVELVQEAMELVESLPQSSLSPEQRFIRAQELGSQQVELLRRADLVLEITSDQLDTSPLLQRALAHPRRLIAVPAPDVLYGSIPLAFTHQKSAHVAYGQRVYQIRHLVAGDQGS